VIAMPRSGNSDSSDGSESPDSGRTADNLVRHELIGLQVTVAETSDPAKADITGQVVDETRQTLVVATDDGEATVPKDTTVFRFTLDGGETVAVDGSLLVARPEERILKKFPRKWEYTDNE
jgi:ribonuclease P protein subunit POP4